MVCEVFESVGVLTEAPKIRIMYWIKVIEHIVGCAWLDLDAELAYKAGAVAGVFQ